MDIRLDIRADLHVDLFDLEDYFDTGSVYMIMLWNTLEHISYRRTQEALGVLFRILQPGGSLAVRGPDLLKQMSLYLNGTHSEDTLREGVFGGQDYPENFHLAGWSPEGLKRELETTGFVAVRETWRDTVAGMEISGTKS